MNRMHSGTRNLSQRLVRVYTRRVFPFACGLGGDGNEFTCGVQPKRLQQPSIVRLMRINQSRSFARSRWACLKGLCGVTLTCPTPHRFCHPLVWVPHLRCLFRKVCTRLSQLNEVYELLSENYVEDDDAMFRFNYAPEFLLWCARVDTCMPVLLICVGF